MKSYRYYSAGFFMMFGYPKMPHMPILIMKGLMMFLRFRVWDSWFRGRDPGCRI